MYGFTSFCTCAKSHSGFCFPLKHSNDSAYRQRWPRSDCVGERADLGRRCPYMPENMFLHGTTYRRCVLKAKLIILKLKKVNQTLSQSGNFVRNLEPMETLNQI